MKLAINSIANNELEKQVRKHPANLSLVAKEATGEVLRKLADEIVRTKKDCPTTSQQLLWELTQELSVPVCIIIIHARVTEQQIDCINEGKESLEVYGKLVCFWALLKTKKDEYAALESRILEKYMEHVFFPESYNSGVISNYADKHGV